MAAEYSAIAVQTVAVDENILFNNGSRACRKGFIQHRNDSGIFFLKGASSGCRAVYRVTFGGNIAIATGGTVEPISVALTINGEELGNATATVTPTVIGAFFNKFLKFFCRFFPIAIGVIISDVFIFAIRLIGVLFGAPFGKRLVSERTTAFVASFDGSCAVLGAPNNFAVSPFVDALGSCFEA